MSDLKLNKRECKWDVLLRPFMLWVNGMYIGACISQENIVKLFENYCLIEVINNEDDNVFENRIIKEYSTNNRIIMKVKVYFEKDKDANPYYSSNVGLHRCSQILQELCSYVWEGEMPLNVQNIINGFYELLFDNMPEISLVNKINYIYENSESYIRNIVYYLSNNIVIISRWAGGFRSSIENDCEFEAEISVFNLISIDDVKKVLNSLCAKYNAKWVSL